MSDKNFNSNNNNNNNNINNNINNNNNNNNSVNDVKNNHNIRPENLNETRDENDNDSTSILISKPNNDEDSNNLSSSAKKSTSSRNIALSTLLATLAKLIETSTNVVVETVETPTNVIETNVQNVEKVDEKMSKNKLDNPSLCQLSVSQPSDLTLNHHNSNISTGSIICRICHNNENIDRLISPCLCKGSLAYVHRYCVEYWLSRSGTLHCELCMHPFNTRNTLRYSFLESLRIWYRHPNNRGLLQSDVFTCTLLTIVSLGLIAMSFLSLRYFMVQGVRIGLSRFWTQSSIIMFLCIVLFAYSINLFFIIRGQIIPWFRWWRSARQVHLILDPV